MYTLHRLIVWIMILVSPARLVAALPITALPAHAALAQVATPAPYQITFDTSQAHAVVVTAPAQPNFDTDVMQPLQAAQAQEAAEAAAKLAAAKAAKKAAVQVASVRTKVIASASAETLAQLRYCEAGGIYDRNSGNGYYGAYQYSVSTWNNYGGFARADLAPAAVQDERVQADVARKGWSAWPACSKKLGL